MPSTFYPIKTSTKYLQGGIALTLRKICDITEKYQSRANGYTIHLLSRDHKYSVVDEQFKKIGKTSGDAEDQ